MQKPEETIKFVKEYLADTGCKTKEELKANSNAADATYAAARVAAAIYAAIYDAIYDAIRAASCAAYAAWADAAADAEYWVKEYEKLTQNEA